MATSLEEFARRLVESGVVSKSEVKAAINSLTKKASRDPEHLARLLVRRKLLTAYQAKKIYRSKGRQLLLGNYLVFDKLGHGGMGVVYKARHRRMDRVVALKVLSPLVTMSRSAVARFQREVQAAARLAHPNIVTAYDADEADGTHFLVLEYIEGTDLSALIRHQGALSVDQALDCIQQTARGLEYAHRQGVIHRDVKPGNLLLDSNGMIKILDMGLARIESADPEREALTGIGQIMGTVDFMAPEQARDTKTADSRADIYSLGATLWYLLTGRVMYEGASAVQKLMAHQTQPIPPLGQECPAARGPLESIFNRMVAKTPGQRYATMREVIEDLERLRDGSAPIPVVEDAPSDESQLSNFFRSIATTSGGAAVATPARAKPIVKPALKATVSLISPNLDTDPAIEQARNASVRRRAKPRPAWRRWWERLRVPRTQQAQIAVAVGVATGLLGLLGIVLWLVAS